MLPIYLYAQNPEALQRWMQLQGVKFKPCFNLMGLAETATEGLILVHLTDNPQQLAEIKALTTAGIKVIALANEPSGPEGAKLFKLGIKGSLNTYTDPIKLQHAIEVVLQGNVWLGQTVMSAMIQNITKTPALNTAWQIGLNDKELETAKAILQGKRNKEIADLLNVTERTIKGYVHQLLEKFDAKDRLGLVLKIQNWPVEAEVLTQNQA